jgi:transcriptional regulator with XRE-family HTH domain
LKLGELIAIARECKGWTLRDLERVSGVSNPLLSQIETGKVKDPGFSTVVRIIDALGVSIERAWSTARPPLSAIRGSDPLCIWNLCADPSLPCEVCGASWSHDRPKQCQSKAA